MKLPPNFFLDRPLSWSAISSFEWDPEQWYQSYVLGQRQTSREMTFGGIIDKQIQFDPTFLPTLPRYARMQHKMKVTFNKIPLIGLPDGLCLDEEEIPNDKDYKIFLQKGFLLSDYKTGKKAWDKKRADETGQLTMYLFLIWITHKIKPEKFRCFIHWLPTVETPDFSIALKKGPEHLTFETTRTMADLMKFGQRINSTVKAMREYADNHE